MDDFEDIKNNNKILISILEDLIKEQINIDDFETHRQTKEIHNKIKSKPYNEYILNVLFFKDYTDNKNVFVFIDKNYVKWRFKISNKECYLEEIRINPHQPEIMEVTISYKENKNTIRINDVNLADFKNINQDLLDIIKLKFDINLKEFDLKKIGIEEQNQVELLKKHNKNVKIKKTLNTLKKIIMNN